ncbi:MAG TPA: glutathione S-transferase N-terminal domain-containing protein [Kofleriaceae bacterium]|jgi:GST-like protein|nr:glutathione S-transferase N-terminal domain-containing protein [Kofleriaceae bacterium]
MIDAYVWTTPNGYKALIALEELAVPYQSHWIDITKGEQKTPAYLAINPNHKIPALVDAEAGVTVFESGAIAIYLAEKTGKLLPASGPARYTTLEWVFFNIGGPGPILGQLGYFAKFAKEKIPHAIERFTTEAERLFGVLDKRLGEARYLAGEFSIADIINFTWPNSARELLALDLSRWPHLVRWLDELKSRPAFAKALALKP